MGMTVEKFGFEEARQRITTLLSDLDNQILRRLQYIGEECCNYARETGSYTDRTGNLRSSIGYRIYLNGEPYQDGGFKSIGGNEGVDKASDALDEYNEEIPDNGFAIVIVAGMNYAVYVESKGYDVINQARPELEKKIREIYEELFK